MVDNKKQWFLLILAAVWLFLALALTAGVYYTTQDVRTLGLATLTAPPIAMFRQLYRYHFPPSAADYEIQKLKLQMKSERAHNRKWIRP
jgi:hypothetical protein